DVFKYEQDGVNAEGKSFGRIVSTGTRPGFIDRLKTAGTMIDPDWFVPKNLVVDDDR
ncbi:MAG: hypothetical protein GY953_17085, partial [bacterium]|nr:hypothetical protein [bacterium]